MDGSILKANPRTLARRQLVRLSNMGNSLCSGFETEFMIMSPDTHEPVFPSADYCETLSFKPFEEFFMDLDRHMVTAKVDLECIRVEQGPGKFEAILRPVHGIDSADQAFVLKSATKEMISDKNLLANYMAKPVIGKTRYDGNGTHLNFSLWDAKSMTNVFYRKDIHIYIFISPQLCLNEQYLYWMARHHIARISYKVPLDINGSGNGLHLCHLNTLMPKQNGRHVADDTFKSIFHEWKCLNLD